MELGTQTPTPQPKRGVKALVFGLLGVAAVSACIFSSGPRRATFAQRGWELSRIILHSVSGHGLCWPLRLFLLAGVSLGFAWYAMDSR